MRRADRIRERARTIFLTLREAGGAPGHADGALTQFVFGDRQHQRRVDAAGERHQAAAELAHHVAQALFFGLGPFHHVHVTYNGGRAASSCRTISAIGRDRSRAIRATSSYSKVLRTTPSTKADFTRTMPSAVETGSTERSAT